MFLFIYLFDLDLMAHPINSDMCRSTAVGPSVHNKAELIVVYALQIKKKNK